MICTAKTDINTGTVRLNKYVLNQDTYSSVPICLFRFLFSHSLSDQNLDDDGVVVAAGLKEGNGFRAVRAW